MKTSHRLEWPARTGVTWPEVLVVLGVVLVAASLLLPATNSERPYSRRSTCINNQSNVALALLNYESVKKKLPGWVMPQVPWSANSAPRQISWVFPLLPALDREDIYAEFGAGGPHSNLTPGVYGPGSDTPVDELHLKILVCPNDTTALGQGANMSYVLNSGMSDGPGYAATTAAALYGPALPNGTTTFKERFASAMFHNNYYEGHPEFDKQLTISASAGIVDGASNTLLCSENIDAGKWTDATEPATTFCWFPIAPSAIPVSDLKINKDLGTAEGRAPRASSYHPGGVVAAFADRHATFIDENVDYLVWCSLFTPRGREVKFAPYDYTSPDPPTDIGAELERDGYRPRFQEKL